MESSFLLQLFTGSRFETHRYVKDGNYNVECPNEAKKVDCWTNLAIELFEFRQVCPAEISVQFNLFT